MLYLFTALDEQEADLFVVYHSHTMTEARPSPTDANFSRMLESPHAWPYWVLVSLAEEPPPVRAWEMHDGEATEVSLQAGPIPAGSTRAQLVSGGDARKPQVREVPLDA